MDGLDETWYCLNLGDECYHISHNLKTISYYFSEKSIDGTYSWNTDVTDQIATEIKNAYANSMKKWNKVYFYCYNSYGYVEKKKVINIIEGTKENHNITIYPTSNEKYIALTNYNGGDMN